MAFLVWRDTGHPEGGGSEVFVQRIAESMVDAGWDATIQCAAYDGAAADEQRNGVHYRRRGGRLSVYLHGLAYLLSPAGRRTDVVVDVQNGLPFFSALVRRRPVVVLVHHVHHEQWQIIYPGVRGHVGWWLESKLAPRLYRRRRYVTVSDASRADLIALGVDADRIDIVHNGIDAPQVLTVPPAPTPTLCVLGRLVPHKQFEHALETLARLRDSVPGLTLDVIGEGWWHDELARFAAERSVTDRVRFHGRVDDVTRDELLCRSWVMIAPSVKEGWGIAIMEAAAHGVPTVAYRSAGGVTEAIVDGRTGWLADDLDDLVKRVEELLLDDTLRTAMGRAAAERAAEFDWTASGRRFRGYLDAALGGPVGGTVEPTTQWSP